MARSYPFVTAGPSMGLPSTMQVAPPGARPTFPLAPVHWIPSADRAVLEELLRRGWLAEVSPG
ncbi:MAG: hypothetical protein D6739_06145 [Nitrospirae bacterium]|nr:MAG: hypothetical protein D6739_06145 [Nitrospirota bacterium]